MHVISPQQNTFDLELKMRQIFWLDFWPDFLENPILVLAGLRYNSTGFQNMKTS